MAENKGTKVIAPIVTPSTEDKFPTHVSNMGKGGYHTAATVIDRDNIPEDRREEGMLCYVIEDDTTYRLFGGLENVNWQVDTSGGGGQGGATSASSLPYIPSGNLESDNVQSAIDELELEKANVDDIYNKEEVDQFFTDLVVDYNTLANLPDLSSLHEHANKETLDKITELDGKLQFDGKDISADSSSVNISEVPFEFGVADSKTVKQILDELLYVPPAITSFTATPNVAEKGQNVGSLNLTWEINKEIVEQSINQGIGVINKDARTYSTSATDSTTYTLTVSDGQNTVTRNTSISFRSKFHYGVSTNETLTTADILTLNGDLATGKARTGVTFSPVNQYIYFAMPTSFGDAKFKVNGLDNDAWVITKVQHTNASGFVEEYTVYRSEFLQNGSGINIDVS